MSTIVGMDADIDGIIVSAIRVVGGVVAVAGDFVGFVSWVFEVEIGEDAGAKTDHPLAIEHDKAAFGKNVIMAAEMFHPKIFALIDRREAVVLQLSEGVKILRLEVVNFDVAHSSWLAGRISCQG